MLGGILSFFGDGEPKLTAQQARDKARAEGNEETLHALAAAEAEQATRADQDWRIFEQDRQQRQQQHDAEMGLSERFGTPPPSSGRARDDKGYERER